MSDNALARYAIDYGGQPAWIDPADSYDRLGLKPVYRQQGDAAPFGYTGGGEIPPEISARVWPYVLAESPEDYGSDLTRRLNALARQVAREQAAYPTYVPGAPEYGEGGASFLAGINGIDESAGRGVRAPFLPSDEVPNAGRVMSPNALMLQMMSRPQATIRRGFR